MEVLNSRTKLIA